MEAEEAPSGSPTPSERTVFPRTARLWFRPHNRTLASGGIGARRVYGSEMKTTWCFGAEGD